MAICSVLWLPTVYNGYLQSTMAIPAVQWLPAVYYDYTCSLLHTARNLLYQAMQDVIN